MLILLPSLKLQQIIEQIIDGFKAILSILE